MRNSGFIWSWTKKIYWCCSTRKCPSRWFIWLTLVYIALSLPPSQSCSHSLLPPLFFPLHLPFPPSITHSFTPSFLLPPSSLSLSLPLSVLAAGQSRHPLWIQTLFVFYLHEPIARLVPALVQRLPSVCYGQADLSRGILVLLLQECDSVVSNIANNCWCQLLQIGVISTY